jgi:hypothetical protein
MTLEEVLAGIDQKYPEPDEENREEVIKLLREIHRRVMPSAEDLQEFIETIPYICGGVYVPYLFWIELIKFIDHQGNRDMIAFLLNAFVNSGFEDEEKMKMKPLLIIYFAKERPFEIDKLKAYVIEKAHPHVQQYMNQILKFVETNQISVNSFLEKFGLLRPYFPNFTLLKMPLSRLKEQMSAGG